MIRNHIPLGSASSNLAAVAYFLHIFEAALRFLGVPQAAQVRESPNGGIETYYPSPRCSCSRIETNRRAGHPILLKGFTELAFRRKIFNFFFYRGFGLSAFLFDLRLAQLTLRYRLPPFAIPCPTGAVWMFRSKDFRAMVYCS
jgi:hypothetical protein